MLTVLEAGAAPLLDQHGRPALESRHLCICQATGAVILGPHPSPCDFSALPIWIHGLKAWTVSLTCLLTAVQVLPEQA